MRQLETSSRLFRDINRTFTSQSPWMDFMRQIRDFRSDFENISRDCRAIVARLSYDSRETLRRSYECRLVLFSRQIVARTVARLSYGISTTIVRESRNIRIVNSPKFRGDMFVTLAWTSYDCRTTVTRQSCDMFCKKKSHKVFKHV